MATSQPPFQAEKICVDHQMTPTQPAHPQLPSPHRSSYPRTWALLLILSVLLFSCLSYLFLLHLSTSHPINNDITLFAGRHAWVSRPHSWRHSPRRVEDTSSTTPTSTGGIMVSNPSDSVVSFPTASVVTSTATASAASTSTSSVGPPPIPTTTPVLPMPFPQPLDSSLNRNFKDQACYNFFLNMTNTLPFRSCRPFSLLLQSSSQFTEAQTNNTELNDIVWGTCNPTPGLQQCTANMGWFADNLKSVCGNDLSTGTVVVTRTLLGLQTYPLMARVGCLSDPTTMAYCYLEAVYSPNPTDLFIYQLPLGIKLPSSANASCSACTKTVMGMYADVLRSSGSSGEAKGLSTTYNNASIFLDRTCGQEYATQFPSGAVGARDVWWLRMLLVVVAAFAMGW